MTTFKIENNIDKFLAIFLLNYQNFIDIDIELTG
jgi:hypothetical protein